MISQILQQLHETSKKNEKEKILLENSDNGILQQLLYYTYNPNILSNLKVVEVPSESGDRNFEDVSEAFFLLYDKLNSRSISGNNARGKAEILLSKCNKDTQKIIVNSLHGDLRCGIAGKTINKAFKNLIPEFKVQLANKYDEKKKYKTDYWIVSQKMDGLRCVFIDDKMFTRSGKDVVGFDEISRQLSALNQKYKYENSDLIFDGELYSHHVPFQKIQGAVTSNKNIDPDEKRSIFFVMFAIAVKNSNGEYECLPIDDMNRIMKDINSEIDTDKVDTVPFETISNNPETIKNKCIKYIEEGYEGAMLRNPYKSYEWKRSDDLLKVKIFNESDFIVTGIFEGTGINEGRLGGFYIESDYNNKSVKCAVGSGFTFEDREYFWNNPEEVIGKSVEIKFQGLTDEQREDGTWALRFPIYQKMKLDR